MTQTDQIYQTPRYSKYFKTTIVNTNLNIQMLFHTTLGCQNDDIMIIKMMILLNIQIIKYSNTHIYNPVLNLNFKLIDDDVSNLSILVYTTMIVRELKKLEYWFILLILTHWGKQNIIQNFLVLGLLKMILMILHKSLCMEDYDCCKFWKVRDIPFWERRVLWNSSQSWETCFHIPSPPQLIWGSPYVRGLGYYLPFRGPIDFTNYNFHMLLL